MLNTSVISGLEEKQKELQNHPIYASLTTLEALKIFMCHHVFAVWDFMSLLKGLQRQVTCVKVPWQPSPYSTECTRLINEIVLGEESDLDQYGEACSHFELYCRAMREIGIETDYIEQFIQSLDLRLIPKASQQFVVNNLNLAKSEDTVGIAANFFYGREKIVPTMFEQIVAILSHHEIEAPTLLYYLRRHIEVDNQDHGPKAKQCLELLVQSQQDEAHLFNEGMSAINDRIVLWDNILRAIQHERNENASHVHN